MEGVITKTEVGKKEEIEESYRKLVEFIHIGAAMVINGQGSHLRQIQGALYYLFRKDKASNATKEFYSDPDQTIASNIWNLPENQVLS